LKTETNVKDFISVFNQLEAQHFCSFHASTCLEHMCSKHVEARNKPTVKQKFCASSWLIIGIDILRCTVSKTSKNVEELAHILSEKFVLNIYLLSISMNQVWVNNWPTNLFIYLFKLENNYTNKISGMVGGTKVRNFRSCTCDLNSHGLTQCSPIFESFSRRFSYLVLDWLFVLSPTHTSVKNSRFFKPLVVLLASCGIAM